MLIELNQDEIEEAIKQYIVNKVADTEGKEITVSFIQKRRPTLFIATAVIEEEAEAVVEVIKEEEPVAAVVEEDEPATVEPTVLKEVDETEEEPDGKVSLFS